MSKQLKKTKQIDTKLKQEGRVIITADSLPFEPGELDYVVHELTSSMNEQEKQDGFVTRQLPREKQRQYFLYDLVYNEDGNHLVTKYGVTDDDVYDR